MLASIKHKGVALNCKGEKRRDKTNYLYCPTAIFDLTSAPGPLLCWLVGSGREKIYSSGFSQAGFGGSYDYPATAERTSVI